MFLAPFNVWYYCLICNLNISVIKMPRNYWIFCFTRSLNQLYFRNSVKKSSMIVKNHQFLLEKNHIYLHYQTLHLEFLFWFLKYLAQTTNGRQAFGVIFPTLDTLRNNFRNLLNATLETSFQILKFSNRFFPHFWNILFIAIKLRLFNTSNLIIL